MTLLWTPLETWGNCTEAPVGQADPRVLVQGAPQEALASLTYSTSGSAAGVSFTGGPWAT